MRYLIVILWFVILGVLTCNISLHTLFYHSAIQFEINLNPNYRMFFQFNDFNIVHHHWMIVKLGHLAGFAVLDLLLYSLTKQHKFSILITMSYAMITEILQLYCYRDGRLYDILIDSSGALLSFVIIVLFNKYSAKNVGVFHRAKK